MLLTVGTLKYSGKCRSKNSFKLLRHIVSASQHQLVSLQICYDVTGSFTHTDSRRPHDGLNTYFSNASVSRKSGKVSVSSRPWTPRSRLPVNVQPIFLKELLASQYDWIIIFFNKFLNFTSSNLFHITMHINFFAQLSYFPCLFTVNERMNNKTEPEYVYLCSGDGDTSTASEKDTPMVKKFGYVNYKVDSCRTLHQRNVPGAKQ